MKTKKKAPKLPKDHVCDNCGRKFNESHLQEISDFWGRVSPGEMLPSGECPRCGALCHPLRASELLDARIEAVQALESMLDDIEDTGGDVKEDGEQYETHAEAREVLARVKALEQAS